MADQARAPDCDIGFFIHLWLERGDQASWRGKVTDGNGEHWFEDGQSLLDFIDDRLKQTHGVTLPPRRMES